MYDIKSELIRNVMDKKIKELEKKYDIIILMGCFTGSCTMNFHNSSSNFTFTFIFDSNQHNIEKFDLNEILEINGKYDLRVTLYGRKKCNILQGIEIQKQTDIKYPVYRTRNKAEIENRTSPPQYRKDFWFFVLLKMVTTDNLWIKNSSDAHKLFDTLRNELYIIDILDFYFTRAQGNYDTYLTKEQKIPLRKYLYTLHEVMYMNWIIEKKVVPPMDFYELSRQTIKKDAVELEMSHLYKMNKESSMVKKKLFVSRNDILNNYIKENLLYIESIFRDYPLKEQLKIKHEAF